MFVVAMIGMRMEGNDDLDKIRFYFVLAVRVEMLLLSGLYGFLWLSSCIMTS